jgi:tetratricopeptide (TPR) repeat protein
VTDPAELYGELVAAFTACRWQEAQNLAEALLPMAARHAGVYGMAGVIALELQQIAKGEEFLRRAVELDPARADFLTLHAKTLAMLGQWQAALDAADKATSFASGDPATLDALGVIYAKAQAYQKAISSFSQAATFMKGNAAVHFNLAMSYLAIGDAGTAQAQLRATLSLDPAYWQAYLALAQIRPKPPARDDLSRLHSLLDRNNQDREARIYLNMALATEYEDLADYPQAFHHLERGKHALSVTRPYSAAQDEAVFDALMQAFPVSDESQSVGCGREDPIFIVGMPRSGTTLLERIITSHPDVYAAGELQNVAMTVQRLSGQARSILQSPDIIAPTVAALDWKKLGEEYLSSARLTGRPEARFVDKLPHNFLYLGFIARALPRASIICLRRDPMDTCVSNFRQLFDRSSPSFDYSFNLLDTGRYYVLFERLMAHWREAFPDRILEVRYEDLIAQQESVSRKVLAFCRLPWSEACFHFEKNPQPVSTFSALEARNPVYQTSVGRWKRFAAQASGLKKLLREADVALAE